jgi:MFS family permease
MSMSDPCRPEERILARVTKPFRSLYFALTILSFHWSIVIYINSSFLEQYLNESDISILYILGALLTIIFFLAASRVLNRVGNYALALICTTLELAALMGMAFAGSSAVAAFWFTVHSIAISLLYFNADVFMEAMIGSEESGTGTKRGLLLTIMSLVAATATLTSGFLLGDGEPRFAFAYITSAIMLLPFLGILMYKFRSFKDPEYPRLSLRTTLGSFWHKRDVRNVFCATLLLQTFFVWMVIYAPLYLEKYMGYSWETIGSILFVGLLAYAIFEWPIGVLADRWIGEQEMMALGFLIIAVTTSWMAFLEPDDLLLWFIVMFVVRVGGSLVEVTTESYFFKHTDGKDASFVSLFRITRPLSYVIGPLLGGATLLFLPFNLLFIALAVLMIPGLFFAMSLHDTR